jgi:DNA-binding winged helix-turn-helix (wHTH) protein
MMTFPSVPHHFHLGPWRVLVDQNRIVRQDILPVRIEKLEPKAMDVLRVLASRPGATVSRDDLLQTVWKGRPVVDGVVSRAVLGLRTRLGDDARAPHYIETIAKRGYRLLMQPAFEPEATSAPPKPGSPSCRSSGP